MAGSDYYRILREALDTSQVSTPTKKPNRIMLIFLNFQDSILLQELSPSPTASALAGVTALPVWGATTNGPFGANFKYGLAGQWR